MKKKIQAGFTLLELMIVVTIVAIIAAFAVPSYINYTEKRAVQATVNDLQSAVKLMRSTSITTKSGTSLCLLIGTGADQSCGYKDNHEGEEGFGISKSGGTILYYPNNRVVLKLTSPIGGKEASYLIESDGRNRTPMGFIITPKSGNVNNSVRVQFPTDTMIPKVDDYPFP